MVLCYPCAVSELERKKTMNTWDDVHNKVSEIEDSYRNIKKRIEELITSSQVELDKIPIEITGSFDGIVISYNKIEQLRNKDNEQIWCHVCGFTNKPSPIELKEILESLHKLPTNIFNYLNYF